MNCKNLDIEPQQKKNDEMNIENKKHVSMAEFRVWLDEAKPYHTQRENNNAEFSFKMAKEGGKCKRCGKQTEWQVFVDAEGFMMLFECADCFKQRSGDLV